MVGIAAIFAGIAVWLGVTTSLHSWHARLQAADGEGSRSNAAEHADDIADLAQTDGNVTPSWQPTATFVLQLLAVAIRHGLAIPRALLLVGDVLPDCYQHSMHDAARLLLNGVSWHSAWQSAQLHIQEHMSRETSRVSPDVLTQWQTCAYVLQLIAHTLEASWTQGLSPLPRLESMVEQLNTQERSTIERSASTLSIRLLMPTGLCFLPAFLCIAVIPAIASFALK